jgi:hypothetical protein
MSRGLDRESSVSVILTYLYFGILAAFLAGIASFIHASFQPTRLPNPGVAAYHVPAKLEVYPPRRFDSSPAPEVADVEPQPASSLSATATAPAQPEPARKSPARKKSKQIASRLRAPAAQYLPPAQYPMTPAQFHSYGYVGPGERR